MIDFLSGLCAGLACAGLGALTTALWLWRDASTPRPRGGQLVPIRTKAPDLPNRHVG